MMENKFTIRKITLRVLSSFITPMQADTIFGTICWAYKYLEGEDKLKIFLQAYDKEPPLIISDGMPAGFFPKPVLKPLSLKQSEQLISQVLEQNKALKPRDKDADPLQLLTKLKALKKHNYMPRSYFLEHQNNFSAAVIPEDFLLGKFDDIEKQFSLKKIVIHSAIDRLTGRAK